MLVKIIFVLVDGARDIFAYNSVLKLKDYHYLFYILTRHKNTSNVVSFVFVLVTLTIVLVVHATFSSLSHATFNILPPPELYAFGDQEEGQRR